MTDTLKIVTRERDELVARVFEIDAWLEKLEPILKRAHGAIADAIYNEDGCDGLHGQAILGEIQGLFDLSQLAPVTHGPAEDCEILTPHHAITECGLPLYGELKGAPLWIPTSQRAEDGP